MDIRTLTIEEASKLSTDELRKLRKDELFRMVVSLEFSKDELTRLIAKAELFIEIREKYNLVPKAKEDSLPFNEKQEFTLQVGDFDIDIFPIGKVTLGNKQ